MAVKAQRWAALVGNWTFRGGAATFLGTDDAKSPVGIAVSDLLFREGTLTAKIALRDPFTTARVIFGLDPERSSQYSIGIGGERFAYYLDELDTSTRTGSVALAFWGPPSSLTAGAHTITLGLRGQSLDFTVNGVSIFSMQLPHPLRGEQVGVLADGAQTRFDTVQVLNRRLPQAFVVMSFRGMFDDLYKDVITEVCNALGIEATRADEFHYPGNILQDVIRGLQEASVVIAEISPDREDAFNANVFYELGYAHATGKPTILLARKGTQLPFDVSGFRVILYDDSIGGKKSVERELRSHLQHIFGLPSPGS